MSEIYVIGLGRGSDNDASIMEPDEDSCRTAEAFSKLLVLVSIAELYRLNIFQK